MFEVFRRSPALPSLFLSALLFLTPQPSFFITFSTIPLLVYLLTNDELWNVVLLILPTVTVANTIASLPTTWNLLPSLGQIILLQLVFSTSICTAIVGTDIAQRYMVRKGYVDGDSWQAAPTFGLIWSSTWCVWEQLSPFGRYGIPSPLPDSVPALLPVLRIAGTTGLDILIGMTGYLTYQLITTTWPSLNPILPTSWQRTEKRRSSNGNNVSVLTQSVPNLIEGIESDEREVLLDNQPNPVQYTTFTSTREIAPTWSRSTTILSFVLLTTYSLLLSVPIPVPISLSSPITAITPLSIGCVLPPPSELSPLDTLIHASETLGSHAKLIVWPESALQTRSSIGRTSAIEKVRVEVSKRYAVWVLMGVDGEVQAGLNGEKKKRKNEVILVGPEGMVGSYEKQRLIPLVESYSIDKGENRASVWDVSLPPPGHVTKSQWNPVQPHHRSVPITPLICLDALHPSLLASSSASLLVIPASSPSSTLSPHILGHAQSLSISHGIPSFVCSASGAGVSALIDPWGRILFQQTGGESFVVKVGIPYSGPGRTNRSKTGWEKLGALGVLVIWLAAVIAGSCAEKISLQRLGGGEEWRRRLETIKQRVMGMWRVLGRGERVEALVDEDDDLI
ncbi:hypothetical protein CI109_102860 [Kwoniella shandongensis]|uniref:Uncharacterized protein n=1 Tax=Kwoniella shandongensis TaxID=1734106 RepID=A0A5M6CBN5_9TREE|nr:uncharacterized protein CI109_000050 [Kwoniella shandongensis]KAA5531212.1 hypothetical protein CI109_000050 [Kwoniella shandongensis]